jgi:hypothetical protein
MSEISSASTERIGSPKPLIPMKTSVGKVSVVAVFICFTPAFCPAQNIASVPGTVNRSIERLTLLPGPHLLSPARNTPTMAPVMLKLEGASGFRFVPAIPEFLSGGQRSLQLIDRSSFNILSLSGRPAEPLRSLTPPPETFHFNSNLKTTPTRMRIELRPPAANPQ